MSDLISRQAAIDHWRLIIYATNTDSRYNMGFVDGLEFCISHLSTMPSAQSEKTQLSREGTTSDCISRQDAIDAHCDLCGDKDTCSGDICPDVEVFQLLPSAQPEPSEMTDEQAILHLQSTGWMQNHDREMYESGLREQLADDSGGYDSLIPCEDAISRQDAIRWVKTECNPYGKPTLDFESGKWVIEHLKQMPSVQPVDKDINVSCKDAISRQDAIDAVDKLSDKPIGYLESAIDVLVDLPSAQPEIIRCKDCEFGEQDEVGRWFCRSLGCQIGNEDGSGFCADAERRTDE